MIKVPIIWGVTTLPLKRNLFSRFMKEGAQETMKDVLTASQEGQLDVCKEEDTSVTHDTFPFVRGQHNTLLNRIVLCDSACFGLHLSIFVVQ
jgi:hypothetical protein